MNNIIETSIATRQLSKILDILFVGKFLNSHWRVGDLILFEALAGACDLTI